MLSAKKNLFLFSLLLSVLPVYAFAISSSEDLIINTSSGQVPSSDVVQGIYASPLPTQGPSGNTANGNNLISPTVQSTALTQPSSSSNSASSCSAPKDIAALFDYARCVISKSIIPFIIGLGVLLFLIGVVQYVASGDNEEKKEAGRNMMIYGIIAIFVMVSVWGFVNILINTFGFANSTPTLPSLPASATTNP